MTNSVTHTAVLVRHPGTHSPAVHGIEARVWWTESGALGLTFVLKGDLSRLRIPPPRPPRRGDHLWEHTCFEAFVSVKGEAAYHEFNFAPSGEWAVYAFRRYRDRAPLADEETAPTISARSAGDRLCLDAVVRLDCLPAMQPRAALRLGLCAVVEEVHGVLSYWAIKHPPGKPDFHHLDAFALELEPPPVKLQGHGKEL